jgi:putative transposase
MKMKKEKLPRLQLIWGDRNSDGTFCIWAQLIQGTIQTIKTLIAPKRWLLVPENEEVDWGKLFPKGFRPQPRRWVVERTFSWIIQWRRLCCDHEGLPSSSEVLIKIAMSTRMLHLLMPSSFSY